MSLNQQLLQQTDAIILRPQPRVRKPRTLEMKVILDSGPLTITEVKTWKGETKYKFKTRSRKRADRKELADIARQVMAMLYPRRPTYGREYYAEHRDTINKNRRLRRQRHNLTA